VPAENVVFQHGGFSNGGTWALMDPWLSATFNFGGTKLVPSLNSTDRLDAQATDLIGRMSVTGQTNFVMIGHSNGGLLSRAVAQRRPDLVKGVVAVSSPHDGVLLARNGKAALNRFLTERSNALYAGCMRPVGDAACWLAWFFTNYSIPRVVDWSIDATAPMINDVQPRGASAFLNQLNATPEGFPRAGVEDWSKKRFILARLGGDALCGPTNRGCGGRTLARYALWTYDGFRVCQIYASLTLRLSTARWCGNIAHSMDVIDGAYDRVSAPGEASDGIVQGTSQTYPRTARYIVQDADSHPGETKSDRTKGSISDALSISIGLRPR
jgi:pimeloyl-ACP methyl ester carboxylesterase